VSGDLFMLLIFAGLFVTVPVFVLVVAFAAVFSGGGHREFFGLVLSLPANLVFGYFVSTWFVYGFPVDLVQIGIAMLYGFISVPFSAIAFVLIFFYGPKPVSRIWMCIAVLVAIAATVPIISTTVQLELSDLNK